jgi:hypothetical protein
MNQAGMRLSLTSVIVALAISAHGCGELTSVTGPSDRAVTVSGRVVEFLTQSPVAAANVGFTPVSSGWQFGPLQTTTTPDGRYLLTVPYTGIFDVSVDGAFAGTVRVNGTAFPGDVFVRAGTCISRYGMVIDSRTLRPINGATVALTGRTVVTGPDGWYRIDLGCPEVLFPGGTTVISAMHPDYETVRPVVGRGVAGVRRLDLALERR